MRKSIDGLMSIVQEELRQDAYSGHLFVFVSPRADRVKILTWDKGGFLLLYKRLKRASSSCRTSVATRWPRDRRHAARCCSTGSSTGASADPITGSPHPRLSPLTRNRVNLDISPAA
jgi:hypothetical protein